VAIGQTVPATPKANRLLAALPEAAYRRLLPDLEARTLQFGEVLFHRTGRLQYAYFPTDGTVVTLSFPVEEGRPMAKTWPVAVGRQGVVGVSIFLGNGRREHSAAVQVAGLAFRLPAAALLNEFKRAGVFQHLLLRYVFALVTQASQLGACNSHHSIEQRLCRVLSLWFAQGADHRIAFTHEHIAKLLGVRRESVTEAAWRLQSDGVIDYQRGNIRLISRKKLQERACPCAAIIQRAFQSVFE
jgi:CRP-like cAMP-binding protein